VVEDQYDATESGTDGISDQEVEHRLAVRADRRQGLAAAVATGHAGGQYQE
jgi:flagellar biosynthesis/type III secretory pathway protein FliH